MSSSQTYGPTPCTALPIALAVTGTAETLVTAANPLALASQPTSLQPSATAPLSVAIPANSPLASHKFQVLASGTIQAAAAENVTVKLYGTKGSLAATVGGNTLLGSSGAVAVAGAGVLPFSAEFNGVYDGANGSLTGTVKFNVANTAVAEVEVSNAIAAINGSSDPVLSFGLSATFSVANATANVVNIPLDGFAVNF